MTVEEVAKWLKVNPQTVRNWVDRGELGALHVGRRRVRIRRSELDRFIGAGETNARMDDGGASELTGAMSEILRAQDSAEMVAALRALAAAAERLAASARGSLASSPVIIDTRLAGARLSG